MNVIHTLPSYNTKRERQIMIQRTYVILQKSLIKREKNKKEQRGIPDGRTLC